MGGIAAGGGPIDRGVDCVKRWPRLKVRRWPRLKYVVGVMMVVAMVVAMHRFLSDGVVRKADHQSDRSDQAFDHGLMFPIEKNAHRQACVPTPFILQPRQRVKTGMSP